MCTIRPALWIVHTTIDLAALPANATDVPLPADGTLMLFVSLEAVFYGGHAEGYKDPLGSVVYVAPGTPVEPRRLREDSDWAGVTRYLASVGDLRLDQGLSLPTAFHVSRRIHPDGTARWPDDVPDTWRRLLDAHPRGADLQLGGYGSGHPDNDPVWDAALTAPTPTDPDNRVLLAQWNTTGPDFEGRVVWWTIDRDDLESRRLDRARLTTHWWA